MRPKTIYVYKDYGNKEYGTFVFDTSKDLMKELSERRVYCKKCGHSVFMNYKTHELICSHCGIKIKKEGKLLFKDRMRELLNEEKNDDKRGFEH